jgi:hypothetical protein
MLPLAVWVKEFYLDLMKEGWKLEEIEEMEMCWYSELANYHREKEEKQQSIALDNAGL